MRWTTLLAAALVVATPARASNGRVSRIAIAKAAHTMTLYDGDAAVATYRVAIGPGGPGRKHREGDKVTPVGRYHIVAKGPSTGFHRFLRLDYPNADDWRHFRDAKARGELDARATIGGDIGIHGAPRDPEWRTVHKDYDWTLGCIAVDDDEIDAVDARVAVGTLVDIED
jgi:murein L,D-transpeptidase YafK